MAACTGWEEAGPGGAVTSCGERRLWLCWKVLPSPVPAPVLSPGSAMKKQFNRMRQLASQTVGRAEKTEVLSDDLLQIERRLDAVRSVCHNSQKRLAGCLQGQVGADADKRHKKLPLMVLSQAMQEGAVLLSDETLLSTMLDICGDAENKLALELLQHEVQIGKDVLEPLNQLTESEIPNIQKQRKQLAKLVLDWDSARARWNQAHKSIGTNFQMHPSKIDSLKEEMDEAGNKVELCKDQLAADMYNFISREGDYGRYFVTLLEAQADYHRKALAVLEKVLPEIQAQQEKWAEKPAFGTLLEEHLKRSGREIALPMEACVMMLLETGMKEEGLFRIAAGASKLKKLKAALDCSASQLEEFYSDPHAVAGALKSYLRELPEPLMTFSLYEEWTQAANISDQEKKLNTLRTICNKLPKANLANFRYLIKFLAKLAQYSDSNKMSPSNIAIVLGPNLLWPKHEGTLAEIAAATSVQAVAIIEPIIQNADWFFPGEMDFNVSGAFVPVVPMNSNHLPYTGNELMPDYGTLEKKRPISMAVMDGELLRKDGLGVKVLELHTNSRRGGTISRKHTSPAFQPPLPPSEAAALMQAGAEQQVQGCGLDSSPSPAGTADLLNSGIEDISVSKPKDGAAATTPPPVRNGAHALNTMQSQPQLTGSSSQLSAGPAYSSAGPSPHMTRRGTKKPAPAPPSAGQLGNQGSSLPLTQPPSVSPKPSTRSPSPPSQQISQGTTQAPVYSHGSLPRRYASSTPVIQAPNHPPPQPPTQATPPLQPKAQTQPLPPELPFVPPPSTLATPEAPLLGAHQPASANTDTSHPQTGTLGRPRPVPKPRNRPSIPPPPHPSVLSSTGEILPATASKTVTGCGDCQE
ncbi:rho GTPase-activating protein 17 isoform X2 [Rhinatrema bivittatum]|uniref:rho GTPase-activating protein 17 isoform X2 n=1 Tax=Rhinatrema bivittatum TaxID=194408 RepID=UPI00112C8C5F|nr:rho GTPase-activating protein 17 isoform X2 [Rhinatrema bivittatum]